MALDRAIRGGQEEVTKLLLGKGAKFHPENGSSMRSLGISAFDRNHKAMVRILDNHTSSADGSD